eukprot:357005-Chlamydomonas_euryale.AAC.7
MFTTVRGAMVQTRRVSSCPGRPVEALRLEARASSTLLSRRHAGCIVNAWPADCQISNIFFALDAAREEGKSILLGKASLLATNYNAALWLGRGFKRLELSS